MVNSVPGPLPVTYNRKPHVLPISHIDFDQGCQNFKVILRGLQVPLPHVLLGVCLQESVMEIKRSLCVQVASVTQLQLAQWYWPEPWQPGVFAEQT
jgi:hypothetical protein